MRVANKNKILRNIIWVGDKVVAGDNFVVGDRRRKIKYYVIFF
jgi:hypothetical protein